MEEFNRFLIVLSRPAESGNVGATCRAMKTMGFSRLAVVSPERELDERDVGAMAVHALDVYEKASFHDRLSDAVEGSSLVVGMTRRRGRKRKAFSLPIQKFADGAWKRPGRIALVFGNERTGLSGEEVDLCHLAVHIPASAEFPSLNLAQAVMVTCWEIARTRPGFLTGAPEPVPAERLEISSEEAVGALERMGFFRLAGREEMRRFLRDVMARAGLSPSELILFISMFRKCEGLWKAAGKGQGSGDPSSP
jgi:TrmH family RNA methyltransferase